ncbi:MAG: patatin-like phospholipase family protein [Saprospiraceae bacterium]
MKALVISGGGSKGAFGGGVAEFLCRELNNQYDIYAGCSTGSLLIPFFALGEIDKIKQVYTTVQQSDVYTICPFSIKELPDGTISSRINHWNTIRMFISRQKTFGNTRALRNSISNIFSEKDFNILKASPVKVIINVANLTTNRVEYKYLMDYSYVDFCDWMWASCSFVPFMSLVEKNGYDYADGGFGDYIPIEAAIDAGATEVDAIILSPRNKQVKKSKVSNPFDTLMQSMDFMMDQIISDDIHRGYMESIYNAKVKIRFFYTPRQLTKYSFYFNPKQMKSWWEEGFQYAKETSSLMNV